MSFNNIFKISGLDQLRELESLSISNNYLSGFESLEHLGLCSSTLTSIDLSSNNIEADPRLMDLIPQVKLLYLSNNPFTRDTLHYRRAVIGRLK